MSAAGPRPWPLEIRVRRAEKVLEVDYDDGRNFRLPAELLRVESPSAEVQQHGGEKLIVPGKRHVGIRDIEAVGHYAVRLTFDDGHDTGIYTWGYLRELGEQQDTIFARYLAALQDKRLSREG
ncbi:MAG: DUF971 domain-containing protein [Alphaproteobacteria bacterium]|nr:DUF971 domain-containing protein [Alphaproteobacteria bacterium]